jgi:hypothetical protein
MEHLRRPLDSALGKVRPPRDDGVTSALGTPIPNASEAAAGALFGSVFERLIQMAAQTLHATSHQPRPHRRDLAATGLVARSICAALWIRRSEKCALRAMTA